jgi:hypothetical protein
MITKQGYTTIDLAASLRLLKQMPLRGSVQNARPVLRVPAGCVPIEMPFTPIS